MQKTYQSHDNVKGMSDSEHKLKAIALPQDLSGLRVLDIGCNEGFFCGIAAQRGASRVLGIDLLAENIAFAKERYADPKIEFRKQSWSSLPTEEFDLILWLSAMHYDPNPKSVLDQIRSRLSLDGTLILETGVFNQPGRFVRSVARYGDKLVYPTMDYLRHVLLEDMAYKWVNGNYVVEGDPVPRHVFHCKRRRQVVIFVGGKTRSGKTFISQNILGAALDKYISIDEVVYDIYLSKFQHSDFEKYVKNNLNTNNLGALYEALDKDDNLRRAFAQWVAKMIYNTDRTVAVDGFLFPRTIEEIRAQLHSTTVSWEMKRLP